MGAVYPNQLVVCIQATWIQATVFFPLGVQLGSKKRQKKIVVCVVCLLYYEIQQ